MKVKSLGAWARSTLEAKIEVSLRRRARNEAAKSPESLQERVHGNGVLSNRRLRCVMTSHLAKMPDATFTRKNTENIFCVGPSRIKKADAKIAPRKTTEPV